MGRKGDETEPYDLILAHQNHTLTTLPTYLRKLN